MRALFVFLAFGVAGLGQVSTGGANSGYLPFDALKHKVTALATEAPERVKLVTFGTSAGGRPMLALEIGTAAGKQAVLVGANIVGYHNAGSQAALDLAERLLENPALTATRGYYILPTLNPDAHDAMFGKLRYLRSGNGGPLDRDRDGSAGEDGPNDLNGDGRITEMRIPDPAGAMIADPADARVMIPAGTATNGRFRVLIEGSDDDGDGLLNEDGPGGERPDLNFPHQWMAGNPEAGAYPGSTPEARAVMDYVLARRNIALAVIYGPANTLLSPVAPPATAGPDDRYFAKLAALYQKSLPQMGFSPERAGAASAAGGLRNWLYHHYGVMAVELDIWGVPPRGNAGPKPEDPITIERLEKMSNEEFLALGEPRISAYLKEIKAPGMVSAKMLIDNVKSGRLNPARMAQMMRSMGLKAPVAPVVSSNGAAAAPAGAAGLPGDTMAYLDKEAPGAFTAWTPVVLPDGTKAEVGGVEPFATIAPPAETLAKASAAHTAAVLAMAGELPRITITEVSAARAGDGVWKVKAQVANTQMLPTHPHRGAGARHHQPVRLALLLGSAATAAPEHRPVSSDNLCLDEAPLSAEWTVRARQGTRITIAATSSNAGQDRREIELR